MDYIVHVLDLQICIYFRERILRHAKDSEENPYWIAPAYKKNQPTASESNYNAANFRKHDDGEPPEKMTKTETFG